MTALRILLDDTYYYNTKRLKENDFSDLLNNWKGHWIILSAVFGKITSEDKETEICAGIVPAFGILNGYIPHWDIIINKPLDYREAETKKLLYVVCSRAKKNLYLFSEQGRTT